jgi:hypothetical protein
LKPEFGPVLNDVHFRYSINPRTVIVRCRGDRSLLIVVISVPGKFPSPQINQMDVGNSLKRNPMHLPYRIDRSIRRPARHPQLFINSQVKKTNSIPRCRYNGRIFEGLLECWLMETKSIGRSNMQNTIRKLFSPKPKKKQFD